jgi:hypothetical protein
VIAQDLGRSGCLTRMQQIRTGYRHLMKIQTCAEILGLHDEFYDLVRRYPFRLREDEPILEEIWDRYEQLEAAAIRIGKAECPIAFFEPSFEQAQCMNAWHPDYEPHSAPEGYSVFGNMGTVRGGKTWGVVASTILWIVPNDPDWPCFRPRVDFLGREVRLLRRFHWDTWNRSGHMRRTYPDGEPPKDGCEIWQGVPDELHWSQKIEKVFKALMPMKWVADGPDGSKQWMRADKFFRTAFGHTVTAKLYGSDMQAWSGDEVWLVNLDEGPPRDKLDEVIYRARYISWSYTPREARNVGDRSKLAFDCYKGTYRMRGRRKFIFPKMSEIDPRIMSEDDKRERIAIGEAHGIKGKAAIEGGFFESSPVVFSNFKRELNVLPIGGQEFLKLFPDANLVRGIDEGTAHPTTCCWMAVLRTGEYVIYREFSEANLSISQRCVKIIDLSRNTREVVVWNQDPGRMRYREVMTTERYRRTFIDSKIFRRDATSIDLQDDWTENYRRAGLSVEKATNLPPRRRCDEMNDLFLADHTRRHVLRGTTHKGAPPEHGAKLYVTNDCVGLIERLENYLYEQVKTGANAGDFTGEPGKQDDDEIDSATYVACAKLRWADPALLAQRLRA